MIKGYDQWKTASPYDYEDLRNNDAIKDAFGRDFSGPADLYRSVYRYTACGPSIGFALNCEFAADNGESAPGIGFGNGMKTIYCDDLRALGTWDDIDRAGFLIVAIFVSSIVEDTDAETETITIEIDHEADDGETISASFWAAVEKVNEQAETIWQDWHGQIT